MARRPRLPVRAFLSSRNFYLIIYQYFASQFTFFICLTWLLPFAKTRYGITSGEAGIYSSIPLYCGAIAMWIGGTAVDRIYTITEGKGITGALCGGIPCAITPPGSVARPADVNKL